MLDINQYTNNFFKYEVENDFFNEKTYDGLDYWDIVRHDVFYFLYEPYKEIGKVSDSSKNNLSKLASVKTLLKLLFSKNKYIFFKASRNNGKDIISKSYLQLLNDVIEIESIYIPNSNYLSIPNLYKFFSKKDEKYKIANLLSKKFGINEIDINRFIDSRVTKFKNDYFFYKLLFKLSKPKIIFMVQNGIQKAMFKAANELVIPIIELQHGYIGYVHPAYSYPENIDIKLIKPFLPKYFFSFSDFWTQNSFYPVEKVTLGCSFLEFEQVTIKSEDIVIVSANIYHDFLKKIVLNIAPIFKDKKIYYKLHPNQFHHYQNIIDEFSQYHNIQVISNEISINDLFLKCDSTVIIQSTATYEALQNKVNVYLYKVADYETHQDVFEYVDLFDTSDDLIKLIQENQNTKSVKDTPTFFEPFNKDKFLQVLQEIESK